MLQTPCLQLEEGDNFENTIASGGANFQNNCKVNFSFFGIYLILKKNNHENKALTRSV